MALQTKSSRGAEYLYFQAGRASLYIAPKGAPSKAKVENVVRALDHVQARLDHYGGAFDELLAFLPPEERRRYARRARGGRRGRGGA